VLVNINTYGRSIMDYLITLLCIGGFIGWSLFGITILKLVCNRQAEIDMINKIREDLKIVREEINKLK